MNSFLYPISVLDLLDRSVSEYPDKIAITDGSQSLTYRQLHDSAVCIGKNLNKKLRGAIRKPIMVFMDKSAACFSAMLGVLYSGNYYVPMDIKTPADRLQAIIDTLESAYIIADANGRKFLTKIGYQEDIFEYEELLFGHHDVDASELEAIREQILDTDLMYVLFTSGSTGIPKGVAITNRSVIDYAMAFTEAGYICHSDVAGNQAPFYTDMSLRDLYMTMTVGATVCVIPQKYFMTPVKLLQFLDKNHVTMLIWVPTAYGILAKFDALAKFRPASIVKIYFSGESMPIPVFNYMKQYYPDASFTQFYGPTEITGSCTHYKVVRDYTDDEVIPIGKPFRNTGILLLDDNDDLISTDCTDSPGEICVYGSCLAAGYYNDLLKTNEVFIQNPVEPTRRELIYRTGDLGKYDEDGNLVFVSRKDFQIKHGGRRIELGEIESGVYSLSEIKSCCCVHDSNNDVISLFYVGDIGDKDLRIMLRDKLPVYMIPTQFYQMEDLPKLESGKLDRKKMKQMASGANSYE